MPKLLQQPKGKKKVSDMVPSTTTTQLHQCVCVHTELTTLMQPLWTTRKQQGGVSGDGSDHSFQGLTACLHLGFQLVTLCNQLTWNSYTHFDSHTTLTRQTQSSSSLTKETFMSVVQVLYSQSGPSRHGKGLENRIQPSNQNTAFKMYFLLQDDIVSGA